MQEKEPQQNKLATLLGLDNLDGHQPIATSPPLEATNGHAAAIPEEAPLGDDGKTTALQWHHSHEGDSENKIMETILNLQVDLSHSPAKRSRRRGDQSPVEYFASKKQSLGSVHHQDTSDIHTHVESQNDIKMSSKYDPNINYFEEFPLSEGSFN